MSTQFKSPVMAALLEVEREAVIDRVHGIAQAPARPKLTLADFPGNNPLMVAARAVLLEDLAEGPDGRPEPATATDSGSAPTDAAIQAAE